MDDKEKIYVTQPFLPPLEEFLPYLRDIWDSKQLTNDGPFHAQLERALAEYLGVGQVSLFANGTIALVTALQSMELTGEVITTPFSFVATSHAILLNHLEPVFVDIDRRTCNLDPEKIEAAITPRTSAILPVHCYGMPCDVDRIQQLASDHGLKVIYDAAHAFGVRNEQGSLLNFGDLSVLSFHATKVFNTFEGGAVISPDRATKLRIDRLKNFGIANETEVDALGCNGKMNEIQAAAGLLQLKHIDSLIQARGAIAKRYRDAFRDVEGIRCFDEPERVEMNHSYFPIQVESGYPLDRDGLYEMLKQKRIFSRRYFYPLINRFPMYRGMASGGDGKLPVAEEIADRVLCLPIYPDLTVAQQDCIIEAVATA